MNNKVSLALAALVLSIVRLLVFIVTTGILQVDSLPNEGSGPIMHLANLALNIIVLVLIAFLLHYIKESIWTSVAYAANALMASVFLMADIIPITNTKIWLIISVVNILTILFFTIRSFLVKNNAIRSGIIIYATVSVAMMFVSMALPYFATLYNWPIANIQLFYPVYILPTIAEVYLTYLFYKHFDNAGKISYNFDKGL